MKKDCTLHRNIDQYHYCRRQSGMWRQQQWASFSWSWWLWEWSLDHVEWHSQELGQEENWQHQGREQWIGATLESSSNWGTFERNRMVYQLRNMGAWDDGNLGTIYDKVTLEDICFWIENLGVEYRNLSREEQEPSLTIVTCTRAHNCTLENQSRSNYQYCLCQSL